MCDTDLDNSMLTKRILVFFISPTKRYNIKKVICKKHVTEYIKGRRIFLHLYLLMLLDTANKRKEGKLSKISKSQMVKRPTEDSATTVHTWWESPPLCPACPSSIGCMRNALDEPPESEEVTISQTSLWPVGVSCMLDNTYKNIFSLDKI